MSQFSPQSLSDVQLQGQPPQSDIQSHPHHLHHPQLHPHPHQHQHQHQHPHSLPHSSGQNLSLNPMMNPGPSSTMPDPNLDPKLSGLNEQQQQQQQQQSKIALANLLPSAVDPKGAAAAAAAAAALDIRKINPNDLLHLLKNLPILQDNNTARRRVNSTSIQPTAGPSTLPNAQPQPPQAQTAPTPTSPITSPTANQPHKGVKRKRGKVGEDGEEMDAEDWTRQRKDNHKEVERRRRGNINHGINELAKVVPFAGTDRAKSAILHRAVTYIHHLKENEARNIEKWTLEKLLMDQAMADLQQQLEEMRRLWDEERQAKQRALLELDVIRSSGGTGSVNMTMGGGAVQQQQQQQQAVAPSNGNHIAGAGAASGNNLPYGARGLYQTSNEHQHQQNHQHQHQRPQHSPTDDDPDGRHGNIILADDDYSGMSKEEDMVEGAGAPRPASAVAGAGGPQHDDAEDDMDEDGNENENDDDAENDEGDEDEDEGDGAGDESGRA